jgi:hypothetical protein
MADTAAVFQFPLSAFGSLAYDEEAARQYSAANFPASVVGSIVKRFPDMVGKTPLELYLVGLRVNCQSDLHVTIPQWCAALRKG